MKNYKKNKELKTEDIVKLFNQKMTIDEFANQRVEVERHLKEIYQDQSQNRNNTNNDKIVFYF